MSGTDSTVGPLSGTVQVKRHPWWLPLAVSYPGPGRVQAQKRAPHTVGGIT